MRETLTKWLPIPTRVLVIALVAGTAIVKFTSYGQMIEDFTGTGVPAPGPMVPVVGVVELMAVIAAILGLGMLSFVALIQSMAVAVIVGGPALNALAALIGALGLAMLGTGALSLLRAETRFLPGASRATVE